MEEQEEGDEKGFRGRRMGRAGIQVIGKGGHGGEELRQKRREGRIWVIGRVVIPFERDFLEGGKRRAIQRGERRVDTPLGEKAEHFGSGKGLGW